jgi:hypothetical protein
MELLRQKLSAFPIKLSHSPHRLISSLDFTDNFLFYGALPSGGGTCLTPEKVKEEEKRYTALLHGNAYTHQTENEPGSSQDAFCNNQVIQKQRVMEGDKINILYNYAPIGLGGEKLHFLITPKTHRTTLKDLTENEYGEAQLITQQLITTLSKHVT